MTSPIKSFLNSFFIDFNCYGFFCQNNIFFTVVKPSKMVKLLEEVTICANSQGSIEVTDSKGNNYFYAKALPHVSFLSAPQKLAVNQLVDKKMD